MATGNLQIIFNEPQLWMVIMSMAVAGGMIAFMHTTVFPEIVDAAENLDNGKTYDKEKMNAYLSSLFVF